MFKTSQDINYEDLISILPRDDRVKCFIEFVLENHISENSEEYSKFRT